jgi:hypothetical protein
MTLDSAVTQAIDTYNRLLAQGETVATAAAEADAIIAAYYAKRAAA